MRSIMTMSATQIQFTPDDVLRLQDEGLYELVNGKLVEKRIGSLASRTALRIGKLLGNFLDASQAGEGYSEQTYQCFAHEPTLVRRPDISFIAASRLGDVPEEGHIPIVPDLAIEVVSPNDKIYELDEKLADYRLAGVKSVWVVNPKHRTIRIHRRDHAYAELHDTETLIDESVLPGFSVAVKDLLPPVIPRP